MTAPPAFKLCAQGVGASLGGNPVLHNISLPDACQGQLVALMGPNGSGKSTLLKSMAGLTPASFRALTLGTSNLASQSAWDRSHMLRYLPQKLPNDVHVTVYEAVLIACKARQRRASDNTDTHIGAILRTLHIEHLADTYIDTLSGGQAQLASLAQALIHQPRLLLLDEPLTFLDVNHQIRVMRALRQLADERGLIIIVVLHDLNMALHFADQAWLLFKGELLASGLPTDVVSPQNLAKAFSIVASVEHSSSGKPYVVIDDILAN